MNLEKITEFAGYLNGYPLNSFLCKKDCPINSCFLTMTHQFKLGEKISNEILFKAGHYYSGVISESTYNILMLGRLLKTFSTINSPFNNDQRNPLYLYDYFFTDNEIRKMKLTKINESVCI